MDQQVAELRQMTTGAHAAAQRAQVIAVIAQLDSAGFHGLDENVAAGNVPAGSLGRVRRARIIAQATNWPAPAAETAAKLVEQLNLLEPAVRDEDASRAAGPAHEVHELEHTLSDQIYAWLGNATPASVQHHPEAPMSPGGAH
jgi:hypothetical protein